MTFFQSEANRAYVYRIFLAVLPILALYGAISDEAIPLIIGLVAAVLPTTLAVKNTSTVGE